MKLSKAVKKARIRLMMTQAELAVKTGLNVRTIQRIEKNKTTSSLYTRKKICEILNLKSFYHGYFIKSHILIFIVLLIIIVSFFCFVFF